MTFKKIITTISLLSLCLPFSGLKKEEQNCLNFSDVKYAFHDNAELVYSYEDIIEASYQKAIERLNDNGVEMPYRSKKRKSVVYNSKMCFENDAKYWKNLSDFKTIDVEPRNSIIVEIKENWFAGSIAFSYYENSVRYVTYATDLSSDTLRMGVSKHHVRLS